MLFEPATPEETGVSSKHIFHFLDRLKQKQVPMHSLLLISKGKLITEGYYAPITASSLQRMFSISKSVTSIAIGLLLDEGRLQLTDKIVSYFPEKVPENVHPFIADMTIQDMLMMRTCRSITTYKLHPEKDWVESFFTVEPTHPSGRIFHYDTSSAHTLGALVEKLTGQKLWDYVREKLSPLPFSKESYMLADPFGVSMGGSGLVATSRDLLCLSYLLYHHGMVDGRQLLSREYLEAATSFLTATSMPSGYPDTTCGYGYQFWRHSKNGFFAYGMGCQIIAFYPEKDFILITTADTQFLTGGIQLLFDAFYEELYPYIQKAALPPLPSAMKEAFDQTLLQLRLEPLSGMLSSPLESRFSEKTYVCQPEKQGFHSFTFSKKDQTLAFQRQEGSELKSYQLSFGFGECKTGKFPIYDMNYAASAIWQDDHTLMIYCHILDSYMGCVKFQLSFTENDLTIFMIKKEESLFQEFQGHLYCTLC